jgi:GNAT superfamily N-acetyltransferase
MEICMLSADDAAVYREVRLAALRDHPTAFTTDYSEDAALSLDEFQSRLTPSDEAVSFGAFEGERLIGIATLVRPMRLRQRFRAIIAAMYVDPAHRRQGVAKELIARCIAHARTLDGLEEACLCVTVGNEGARQLYIDCGFEPDVTDPRYFKYEGRYYDLEWLRFPLA